MRALYRLSAEAINDLEQIWLDGYITWSLKKADRYHQLITDEIEYISRSFETASCAGHIRMGYRSSKVKSHVIYFRPWEDKVVEVVRILHERMDMDSRLK